jgi:hypothetical protein
MIMSSQYRNVINMSKSISPAFMDVNSGREQTSLLIKTFVNFIIRNHKVRNNENLFLESSWCIGKKIIFTW